MKTAAIILAGGSGKRFGESQPKQFVKLHGKTILFYSIEKFFREVDRLVVVCHGDYISVLEEEGFKNKIDFQIVRGGDTRQLSARNGLLLLENDGVDYVAIHDSSRPLFSIDLVKNLFSYVVEKKAVIPVLPVSNTVAIVKNKIIDDYLPRERLFMIQTPQVFEFRLIFDAHELAYREKKVDFTDDSQLIRFVGERVYTVAGEETNIKITTKPDLLFAEQLLSNLGI